MQKSSISYGRNSMILYRLQLNDKIVTKEQFGVKLNVCFCVTKVYFSIPILKITKHFMLFWLATKMRCDMCMPSTDRLNNLRNCKKFGSGHQKVVNSLLLNRPSAILLTLLLIMICAYLFGKILVLVDSF